MAALFDAEAGTRIADAKLFGRISSLGLRKALGAVRIEALAHAGAWGESEIRPLPGPGRERISDSKLHWQSIESSVVFGFGGHGCGCHRKLGNFKSTTLV